MGGSSFLNGDQICCFIERTRWILVRFRRVELSLDRKGEGEHIEGLCEYLFEGKYKGGSQVKVTYLNMH